MFSKATSVAGNDLEMDLDPVLIKGIQPAPVPIPEPVVVPEPPKPEPAPEPVVEPQPAAAPETVESEQPEVDAPATEDSEQDAGMWSVIWFSILNLFVILGGGAGFWFFRKRRAAIYSELIDEDVEATEDKMNAELPHGTADGVGDEAKLKDMGIDIEIDIGIGIDEEAVAEGGSK